tara:strand:- start:1121 stop:1960 length:840 start_codon:yes stop_codon:yes gene_type:complete
MKLRHNKKRNTAFIFEALVRELTKCVVEKKAEKKEQVVALIKKHFRGDSVLAEELRLYKILTENKGLSDVQLDFPTAHRVLQETKAQHGKLDKEEIFAEQSHLIKTINRMLSKDVFSNFVPNYKSLATVYQIFNSDTSPQKRVLLEDEAARLISERASNREEENKAPSDNMVFNMFVEKFNNSYSSKLLSEQKELVNRFITSFVDNSVGLKIFLNEELGRLKETIKEAQQREQINSDPDMLDKTHKVLALMESFNNEHVDATTVEKILKIQHLVREIQE